MPKKERFIGPSPDDMRRFAQTGGVVQPGPSRGQSPLASKIRGLASHAGAKTAHEHDAAEQQNTAAQNPAHQAQAPWDASAGSRGFAQAQPVSAAFSATAAQSPQWPQTLQAQPQPAPQKTSSGKRGSPAAPPRPMPGEAESAYQATRSGSWRSDSRFSNLLPVMTALLQLVPVLVRGAFAGLFMPVFLIILFTLFSPIKYWWVLLFLGLLFSSRSVGKAVWGLRKNPSIKPRISLFSVLLGGAVLGSVISMVWQRYLFPQPEMSYVLTYELINNMGLFLGQLLEGKQGVVPLFTVPQNIADSELQIGLFCVNNQIALYVPYIGIVWGFFSSWAAPAPVARQ